MALDPSDSAILAQAVAQGMKAYHEVGGASGTGKGKFVTVADLSGNAEQFKKALQNLTHNVKDAAVASKSAFNDVISAFKGGAVSMMDNSHELDKLNEALKESQTNMKSAAAANDAANIALEQSRQTEIKKTKAAIIGIQVAQNLTAVTAGVINAYVDYQYALKSLQLDYEAALIGGKSAIDTYTDTVKGGMDAQTELRSSLYQVEEAAGGAAFALGLMLPGWGKILSLLGLALSAWAGVNDRDQKKQNEFQKKNLENLRAELNKTIDSYKLITESGGALAGGMTEMNVLAIKSGYGVKLFGEGLKLSRDSIQKLGMSYDDSVQLLSRFGQALHKDYKAGGDLAMQLDKLGWAGEHQIEIMAEVSAKLKMSGDERYNNEQFVAAQSVEYAKTLKVMTLITGQNAKDALKKAQQESLEAGLFAKFGGVKGATDKLTQQIAQAETGLGAGYKAMYVDYMRLGRFRGAAANIIADSVPQIRQELDYQKALLNDTTKTADEQSKLLSESNERIKLGIRGYTAQNQSQIDALAQAEQSSGTTKEMLEILSGAIQHSTGVYKGQAIDAAKIAETSATNKAKLDDAVARAQENQVQAFADMDKKMSASVEDFAQNIADTKGGFDALLTSMGAFGDTLNPKSMWQKFVDYAKGSGAAAAQRMHDLGHGRTNVGLQNATVSGGGGAAPQFRRMTEGGAAGAAGAPGGASPRSLADIISFGGNTGDEAHFRQADPALQGAFVAMAQEYYEKTKKKLHINSAFRSLQEQTNVVSTSGMKAKPGHSLHERGKALDINSSEVAELSAMGLLERYKFNTLAGDPMHIQMADNGANLGVGDSAIVGEMGPEIVSGPGSVTSRSQTSQVFAEMTRTLKEISNTLKNSHSVARKTLNAVA